MSLVTGSRHLLSIDDLGRSEIESLLDTADTLLRAVRGQKVLNLLDQQILVSLFYQPSLRTELSFQSAMLRLGGRTIALCDHDKNTASYRNPEALADVARTVSGYCNAVVIRHPKVGAPRDLADFSTVPVVNAGDGIGPGAEHPTQALVDLMTIRQCFGRLDDLTILMIGELHSRAARSLMFGLTKFDENSIYQCYPEGYGPSKVEEERLISAGVEIQRVEHPTAVIHESNVLYHCGTRDAPETYDPTCFGLNASDLPGGNPSMIVMHPLPRRHSDVAPDIDDLPQACYFRQARNALPLRMAVLLDRLIPEGMHALRYNADEAIIARSEA